MKTKIIVIIIVVAILIIGAATGITLAFWNTTDRAEEDIELTQEEDNPSAKHIIYRGLDGNGVFTDVAADIVSYAVVGYDGFIEKVVIPSTYNEKNVTAILYSQNHQTTRLAGNGFITQLTIPETVTRIGAGVVAGLENLQKVTILGSGEITFGTGAFAGCIRLTEFYHNDRTLSEQSATDYLIGTPLDH